MSEEKLRRALENCTKDAVALRKKITQIEDSLKDQEQQTEKAKRALKNCLTDVVDIRKKIRTGLPAQRIKSRRSLKGTKVSRKRRTSRKSTRRSNKRKH